MIRVWTHASDDPSTLACELEAHLNEHAGEVISVSYAQADGHRIFAVYRVVDVDPQASEAAAEHILDEVDEAAAP